VGIRSARIFRTRLRICLIEIPDRLAISATDMPRFSRPTICRSRSAGRYAPCGGLGRTDRGEPSLEKDGGADALGMGMSRISEFTSTSSGLYNRKQIFIFSSNSKWRRPTPRDGAATEPWPRRRPKIWRCK
jgi:hypothetical protein